MPNDVSMARLAERLGGLEESLKSQDQKTIAIMQLAAKALDAIQRHADEKAWNEDARAVLVELLPISSERMRDEQAVQVAVSIADMLAEARAKRLGQAAARTVDELLQVIPPERDLVTAQDRYGSACGICKAEIGALCKVDGNYVGQGQVHRGR
jgi:hypothetical protein